MIKFEKFTLKNGLRFIVHEDRSTPLAVFNTLYDVGSKDERIEKTGFAHLFEHLMFGGSVHIPDFDQPLQNAGGESNAFTSADVTNYYDTVPAVNLETPFWLESDRMLSLAFTDKSLEVQRSVVIEEFKQRYLNQPYGDVWLLIRPLVFEKSSYNWATIGKEIEHIEQATMDDVKSFFSKHYTPQNAVICVAGNVELEQVKNLAEKWFGEIESGNNYVRDLEKEPKQQKARKLVVERDVPVDAIYKIYRMPNRMHEDYPIYDLLSDVLSRGASSRLYQQLVKEKQLFSEIGAYISGEHEEGLFIVSGKLHKEVNIEDADKEISAILLEVQNELIPENELTKVKNKFEATKVYGDLNVLSKAMNLCLMELLGDINKVNTELASYQKITSEDLIRVSEIFKENNCSTLHYLAKK